MARALGYSTSEPHLGYALAWEQLRLPVLEHRAGYWPDEWDSEAAKCRALITIYSNRIASLQPEAN